MNRFLKILASIFIVSTVFASVPASAVDLFKVCDNGVDCKNFKNDTSLNRDKGAKKIWQVIRNILFFVGAAAVIVIIFAGFSYATSAGDHSKLTKAKNMIVYSVVGLIISLLATTIVSFVISSLSK